MNDLRFLSALATLGSVRRCSSFLGAELESIAVGDGVQATVAARAATYSAPLPDRDVLQQVVAGWRPRGSPRRPLRREELVSRFKQSAPGLCACTSRSSFPQQDSEAERITQMFLEPSEPGLAFESI